MQWGPLEGEDDIRPDREWMDLEHQPGFMQRAKMVADLANLVLSLRHSYRPSVTTITDLGCGDGSMMRRLNLNMGQRAWGYELGAGDVAHAQKNGLDVRQIDIVQDWGEIDYGHIIIASEVLEHLDEPVTFLRRLPQRTLIASSPSRETGEWHNRIHRWAWDLDGYRDVLSQGGWRVIYQAECDGGDNTFNGITGSQRFQAVIAMWK